MLINNILAETIVENKRKIEPVESSVVAKEIEGEEIKIEKLPVESPKVEVLKNKNIDIVSKNPKKKIGNNMVNNNKIDKNNLIENKKFVFKAPKIIEKSKSESVMVKETPMVENSKVEQYVKSLEQNNREQTESNSKTMEVENSENKGNRVECDI